MILNEFYDWLKEKFNVYEKENKLEIIVNNNKIIIDCKTNKFSIDGGINYDHSRIFDLTKQEFVNLLKRCPTILSLSEKSIELKSKQIRELDISKHFIISRPSILAIPQNTLKIRYLILRQVANREEIFEKQWFMTSQNKTYARLKFLARKTIGAKLLNYCLIGEKQFSNQFGVSSEELMKNYSLTANEIDEMLDNSIDLLADI